MKHSFISAFLLLIFLNAAFAQETTGPTPVLTTADYLHKSKTQKIAGFILLGAGIGTVAAVSGGSSSFSATEVAVIAGGACVVSSIVLFIASGRNKRKASAMAVNFRMEKFPQLQTKAMSYVPAVHFVIKI